METFFRVGCQIDEVKLIDLVLRRYHTLDVLKVLDIDQVLRLLLMAIEDEQKERYREEWLHLIPAMVFAQHYMTFEEFYNTCTGANIDNRPVDEIIAEIDRKHAEAREETNGNGNL